MNHQSKQHCFIKELRNLASTYQELMNSVKRMCLCTGKAVSLRLIIHIIWLDKEGGWNRDGMVVTVNEPKCSHNAPYYVTWSN